MKNHKGQKFVWDDKTNSLKEYIKPEIKNESPAFIPDEITPLQHPCNGNIYSSKSQFRKITKLFGCSEIDPGFRASSSKYDDDKREREIVEALSESYHDVKENRANLSELDRERCAIQNRQLLENRDNRDYDHLGRLRK